MAASPKSRHAHGRSEIWERVGLARAVQKERTRLGKRLRALRETRKLTQEEAAELIGVHPYHLRRMEAGTQSATLTFLVAVSIAFRVRLRSLFDNG